MHNHLLCYLKRSDLIVLVVCLILIGFILGCMLGLFISTSGIRQALNRWGAVNR